MRLDGGLHDSHRASRPQPPTPVIFDLPHLQPPSQRRLADAERRTRGIAIAIVGGMARVTVSRMSMGSAAIRLLAYCCLAG